MFTEWLQSVYFSVTSGDYNLIRAMRKFTCEVRVQLEGFRKMVLILCLLAAALAAGCAAGQSPSVAPVNTSGEAETMSEQSSLVSPESKSDEQETTTEQPPPPSPESESEQKETVAEQPSLVPEQSGGTSAEQPPAKQEKPLVIVSENFVLTDSGQLLQALDKEMEALLDLLEKMDDIQNEDLNF